jgi:hypothetical protein
VVAAILLGPTRAHLIAIALIGKLHSLGYSRDAESKADVTGSDTCAQAGYNPWGLVWLFQDFQNADVNQIPAASFRPPGRWHEDTNAQFPRLQCRDEPSRGSEARTVFPLGMDTEWPSCRIAARAADHDRLHLRELPYAKFARPFLKNSRANL